MNAKATVMYVKSFELKPGDATMMPPVHIETCLERKTKFVGWNGRSKVVMRSAMQRLLPCHYGVLVIFGIWAIL
jgi:ABC-type enterochelin transport system ATPase subunit